MVTRIILVAWHHVMSFKVGVRCQVPLTLDIFKFKITYPTLYHIFVAMCARPLNQWLYQMLIMLSASSKRNDGWKKKKAMLAFPDCRRWHTRGKLKVLLHSSVVDSFSCMTDCGVEDRKNFKFNSRSCLATQLSRWNCSCPGESIIY